MQTTLRIDDNLYRQAKVEAAREGITLTQFIQEALALRLQARPPKGPARLPTFRGGPTLPGDFDLLKTIRQVEKAADRDLAQELLTPE